MKNKKQKNNIFGKITSKLKWWKKESGEAQVMALPQSIAKFERDAEEAKYFSLSTFQLMIVIACITFLLMPFVTTFNEFLAKIIMKVEIYKLLQEWVVPFQAKMITSLLRLMGITAQASMTNINMVHGETPVSIFINWNCIGWQSFILLLLSMFTGLKGPFTIQSKIETLLIGIMGTILVNVLRIALVSIIAYQFGQVPAVIFHDYVSTIMMIGWLIGYWIFSYKFILHHTDFVKVRAGK